MSTSKAAIIPTSSMVEQDRQATQFLGCQLRWRQKHLLVTLAPSTRKMYLRTLDNQRWLVDCLKLSPVKAVCIDPALGETDVKLWADACAQANKALFLRLPPQMKKAKQQNLFGWRLQELVNRAIAALLILVISPVLLGLFCMFWMHSLEPLSYQQWCMNKRGRLFRLYKFQTITTVHTQQLKNDFRGGSKNLLKRYGHFQLQVLGQWLRQYQLDRLPELFNVLRGEIGIVEQQHLTLEQAVRLSVDEKPPLGTLRSEPQFECSLEKLQPAGVEYKH